MTVVPFRWQGKSRVEQARALVHARSQEWLRQWSAGNPTLEVASLPERQDLDSRASDRWYRIAGSGGAICVKATGTMLEQLGCRLAGVIATDSQGLAVGVGRRAFADLLKALADSDEVVSGTDARPSNEALLSRCGVVGLRWSLDAIVIELYLDAKWCDAVLPHPQRPPEGLVARNQAILPGELTLHAVLDLGRATLEDTLVLRPGEIIKTSVALGSLIGVQAQTGETLFTGALVAADGRRAVRCTRNPRD